MQTNHTQGPWFSDHTPTADDMVYAIEENPTWVAVEAEQGHVAYCHPDNAELIAAAPELLSALQLMLSQFQEHKQYDDDGYDTEAIEAARSAISKATGH